MTYFVWMWPISYLMLTTDRRTIWYLSSFYSDTKLINPAIFLEFLMVLPLYILHFRVAFAFKLAILNSVTLSNNKKMTSAIAMKKHCIINLTWFSWSISSDHRFSILHTNDRELLIIDYVCIAHGHSWLDSLKWIS